MSYKIYDTDEPQSVPWTAKVSYPRTFVIRVLYTRAVSTVVQLAGGLEEKLNPGREGITISYATDRPSETVAASCQILRNG